MFNFMASMTPVTAQTYSEYLKNSVDWAQTATVVISGVLIVMVVLIVLIFIFKAFGLTVSKTENAAKKNKKKVKAEQPKAPAAPAAKPVAPAPAPVVQNGVSAEVVAAITAAITASEGNSNFAVRSIRVKNVRGRNPWASAAIADNVRPF